MLFYKEGLSRRMFIAVNNIFLGFCAIVCIFPLVHLLAISFSSSIAVDSGMVLAWPKEFQLDAYINLIANQKFYSAFAISVLRTVLGVVVNMMITVLAAYPLSMNSLKFRGRQFFVWFFIISMLFSGGLIPTYLVVSATGLLDTIWALILPGAVPVFNLILLQNFIKELPDEISESASIDGASHWRILFRIVLPLSTPVLATLVLFVAVTHWNAWFDGMLYMNRAEHYPLQTYLRSVVVEVDLNTMTDITLASTVTEKNNRAAQIITAMIPVLLVYPFLQKYFTTGIVLGSVKG